MMTRNAKLTSQDCCSHKPSGTVITATSAAGLPSVSAQNSRLKPCESASRACIQRASRMTSMYIRYRLEANSSISRRTNCASCRRSSSLRRAASSLLTICVNQADSRSAQKIFCNTMTATPIAIPASIVNASELLARRVWARKITGSHCSTTIEIPGSGDFSTSQAASAAASAELAITLRPGPGPWVRMINPTSTTASRLVISVSNRVTGDCPATGMMNTASTASNPTTPAAW